MIVEVSVHEPAIELIDLLGVLRRYMIATIQFPYHAAILGFYQSIVVRVSCSGLREFYVELGQQSGYHLIDELRAVIGVELMDHEGETQDQFLNDRSQELFRDLLYCRYHFPLGYLIHDIDVVDAFDTIAISLMNCIYPQKTWLSLRSGLGSDSDINLGCSGMAKVLGLRGIVLAILIPDVVEMGNGDAGNRLIFFFPKDSVLSAQNPLCRLAAQMIMGTVRFNQAGDIAGKVFLAEAIALRHAVPRHELPDLSEADDQASQLGYGQLGDFCNVVSH